FCIPPPLTPPLFPYTTLFRSVPACPGSPQMLFNSLSFLIFFALFVPAYYATHGRVRLVIALVASNLFYAWWDWRFLGLLWFSTRSEEHTSELQSRGHLVCRLL